MSLLVLNSSSGVAQGLIKHFYNKGQFQKIVCADLYPCYSSIQKYCQLKESLQESKTEITDQKFSDRQDLNNLIKKSSHILHITHDYYEYVAPKQNLLKTTAQLAQDYHVKNYLSVNPVEHRHQYDTDSQEVDLKQINDQFKQVNCDLVFGEHSSVVNKLIKHLVNKQALDFKPSLQQANPIYIDDLAQHCENVFENKANEGTVKGKHSLQLSTVLSVLESCTKTSRVQPGVLDNLISAQSNGVLNQYVHSAEYRNLVQFLHNYKSIEGELVGDKSFEEFYANHTAKVEKELTYYEKLLF